MPEGRAEAQDADVADEMVEIHLELTVAGESLTGFACDEHGARRRFDGRLGLLAAIDVLIGAAPARALEDGGT